MIQKSRSQQDMTTVPIGAGGGKRGVPFASLQYACGELNYAARLTDQFDALCVKVYLPLNLNLFLALQLC